MFYSPLPGFTATSDLHADIINVSPVPKCDKINNHTLTAQATSSYAFENFHYPLHGHSNNEAYQHFQPRDY